jgi:rubrerythrin
MDESNTLPLDRAAFREIVRHPQAHAHVLSIYRLGEYAGVVALDRLLREMQPEGKLHEAMTMHLRDERRHASVFTDWIERLGQTPAPYPANVEDFFTDSSEDADQRRAFLEGQPLHLRRVLVFAGLNAVERLAFNGFEEQLASLERRDDRELLQGVMDDEKFHLSYVEHELERESRGENAAFVTAAVEQARERFGRFFQARRVETTQSVERLIGTAP